MDEYNIVTIGGAVRDIIFYTNEGTIFKNPEKNPLFEKVLGFEAGAKIYINDISFLAGGGAFNTAAGFSKLGIKVATITRVGDDQNGKKLIKQMKSRGINTDFVQVDKKHSTAFSFIPCLKDKATHSIFTYHGAVDYLSLSKQLEDQIMTDWFYISSLSAPNWPDILKKVLKLKSKINAKIAWNPSNIQIKKQYKLLVKFLKQIDLFILNEDEAKEFVSKIDNSIQLKIDNILKNIYEMGPKIVAITCGKKGAYAFNGKDVFFEKTKDVKVKNTTGAGDSFSSGFLASLFYKPDNIKRALSWGILNSNSVIKINGAQKGLLSKKEIIKGSI
ncbi:MAG TPA: carbohydrate kinase family protein [Patescibacteria group bacterium]|nr:carbohydrate kinase family protein [Patescibacteria group bacterium]